MGRSFSRVRSASTGLGESDVSIPLRNQLVALPGGGDWAPAFRVHDQVEVFEGNLAQQIGHCFVHSTMRISPPRRRRPASSGPARETLKGTGWLSIRRLARRNRPFRAWDDGWTLDGPRASPWALAGRPAGACGAVAPRPSFTPGGGSVVHFARRGRRGHETLTSSRTALVDPGGRNGGAHRNRNSCRLLTCPYRRAPGPREDRSGGGAGHGRHHRRGEVISQRSGTPGVGPAGLAPIRRF
jgi:hypothetical protein